MSNRPTFTTIKQQLDRVLRPKDAEPDFYYDKYGRKRLAATKGQTSGANHLHKMRQRFRVETVHPSLSEVSTREETDNCADCRLPPIQDTKTNPATGEPCNHPGECCQSDSSDSEYCVIASVKAHQPSVSIERDDETRCRPTHRRMPSHVANARSSWSSRPKGSQTQRR